MRVALLTTALCWVLLLAGCSGSGDRRPINSGQSPGAMLSQGDALEIAVQESGHLIGDSHVQEMRADLVSYRDAVSRLAKRGLTGSDDAVSGDSLVWLVTLKGVFREPAPGQLEGEATTPTPRCSEIIVLIDDAAGQAFRLMLLPAESCS